MSLPRMAKALKASTAGPEEHPVDRQRAAGRLCAAVSARRCRPAALRKNEAVLDFVRQFAASGKPIAAVCHGPQILVSAGLVRGRTLSSYPEVASEITEAGGTWTDEALQIDGQFITARYPGDLPRHLHGTLEVLEGRHEGSSQARHGGG